jgi:hypothetical protein
MTAHRNDTLRRRALLGASIAASLALGLPGMAQAQSQAQLQAADPATDTVRRLMVLSTQTALNRLGQPNAFLLSNVARFGMPVLFTKGATGVGPLAQPAFRQQLIQRLNQIAESGARGAVPAMAEASRKLPIPNASALLHGRPTAATSALRLEMGSGLVNALRGPIEQALIAARDPTIAQAVAALPGVTLGDVAQAIALSADNGIWYEIGAAEVDIRANPAASGDAVLAAGLTPQPVIAPVPPR